MPKRKKKTISKKKKDDSIHESSPPPVKKVVNEASSTSQFEEDMDHVQSFTSIAIQNSNSEQSHYWCNYCSFSTEHRNELIGHMRVHMKKCPFCLFTSLYMKEVTKHCKMEHDKDLDSVPQETESSTACEMDKDPCSACVFCEFMTYSTEHLERHTILKHPGMLAKSVAKMITKQSSAQIRKEDASFYSTISNESLSDIKKSSSEYSTIVIDVPEEKQLKNVKQEAFQSPSDIKANEIQTKPLKKKIEVHAKSRRLSAQGDDISEDISSSVGRIVKVETMYCLTCPYSNVYVEKLKCHTLAQHPLGPAACSYNSITENSGDTEITFFCIRETCSYNTVDSQSYQKHLMECCSYRSAMTVIEKERLQASIAYVVSFQRKFKKDSELGFSDFAQNYFKHQPKSDAIAAGRGDLLPSSEHFTRKQYQLCFPEQQLQTSNIKTVQGAQQIINPALLQQLGSDTNILHTSRHDKAPEIYPAGIDRLMMHLGNTQDGIIHQRLALALGSDMMNVNKLESHQLQNASNFVNTQQQKIDETFSKTILLSEQSTPQKYISPAGAEREKLFQSNDGNDGVLTNSAKTAVTHDSFSQTIQVQPTSLVGESNAEMWQNSQPLSSSASFTHQPSSQTTHNIGINDTLKPTSVQQTDVPNFLVTTNSPMPETDTNCMAQTNSTFLTPSNNAGILAESLSSPPKHSSTQYMANSAGSSPLSPSIYLSGQVPRHRRTNWTDSDMQPRGMMAPQVVPRYQGPPGHTVRQRLFTPANMRGRNTRGRVRMPHTPRQNTNGDDDDVIVTAVVKFRPNPGQPAMVGPSSKPIGRMAPMQRLTSPTANQHMPSPMQNLRAAAPPKQQFDISKHFEDLACVVNSTGDEEGVSQGDDDIQILAVTPAKANDKDKPKQQPKAVDASKFSFCCVHCGKDQGSKNRMKQHMKAYHNDSLIGAFTNTETGQLLYFCPQITCEFMTYEERRLSEHLYKCYNLDNSKPFDVITAIKNLKSVKIRQLDVRSMGRSQNNPVHLDGQGLKDNFSNSLNDAFDDIVVNASGRYMPKPVSTQRPTQINQNNSMQLHQNNSTQLHQNSSVHPNQNYSTQLHPNNSAPPRPSVRPAPVRNYPTPRPSYGPQSPYGTRPQHNEWMRPRFPTPRLDMRPPRPMNSRPSTPAKFPVRPFAAGLRFGGEQEPIVIDDEPSEIVGNVSTGRSEYSNENSTMYPIAGEGRRQDFHNSNNGGNDYSLPSQTVPDFTGLQNTVVGSSESAQQLCFASTTATEFSSSNNIRSNQPSPSNFSINNQPNTSTFSNYMSNQPTPSKLSTNNQPAPSYFSNYMSNQPISSSNIFAENNALHPTIAHENVTANVSLTHQNTSAINTTDTNPLTPRSETFTSSSDTLESGDEEEKHYAYMLEKVFAKVPNMPKTLSRRLISKFKQYSQSIGVKINSNVIDEFVSKISYKGSSTAKAPAAPTAPPVEKVNTCTGEEPGVTDDPPDQSTPDVLTTQIIMAERQLKFSGSFANIPLKTSNDTIARVEPKGGVSNEQDSVSNEQDSMVDVQQQQTTDSVDGNSFQSDKVVPSIALESDINSSQPLNKKATNCLESDINSSQPFNKKATNRLESDINSSQPLNKKATNRLFSQLKLKKLGLVRRNSADVINEHSQAFETTRSSSCPLIVSKTIGKRTISSHMVSDDFESPIQLDFVSPAITQKESCLMSTTNPIVITSSVDHIVSGNDDLEVDIAGRPENTNLLVVEKLEPPEIQDQELSNSNRLEQSSHATAQEESAPIKSNPPLKLTILKKNGKDTSGKNQKVVKKSSVSKKKKPPNSPAGKLILKVRKRGRPRTKLIEDVSKLDPNPECPLVENEPVQPNANDDTEVLENSSCKDKLAVIGESLNTEECELSNTNVTSTMESNCEKTKDDADEKSNKDDESENKHLDDPGTKVFVRRSDRKRKAISSDYRVDQGAELDELLGDTDEDYFMDDDDSDNDESTWMKESGLASKKKVKKVKPPPDPTAFDVATKGKFKCWLCKKIFLKSTFAKAHLLKKHKEGLCSIDLLQTEETGVLHLLLYCLRDCKYATFSLDGLKNHIASCEKPEYTDRDDNYVKLNQDFIDCFYPELMKSDVKELLQPKIPKDTSKSSKPKKAKQSKDVKTSLHPSTSEDTSNSEQSSVSLPLQKAVCASSHQIPAPQFSIEELSDIEEIPNVQSPTSVQLLQNAKNNTAGAPRQHTTTAPRQHSTTAPPGPRYMTEHIDPRLLSPQHAQRVTPPQIAQKFFSPQSLRMLGDQIVPRPSAPSHNIDQCPRPSAPSHNIDQCPRPSAPSHNIDQCGLRLMYEQHPLRPSLNQSTVSKFTEHPRPSVRQSMQSKQNIPNQLPNSRPISRPAWHAQTDSNVQFTHSSDPQARQVPKCPPPARLVASDQSSQRINPNVASSISQWHVESFPPYDAPQESDSIYVEENGTICLE